MSKPDPQLRKEAIPEELFAQALSLMDDAVRAAFLRCRHHPTAEEAERLKQRLIVRLLEDDFRRLRTFDQRGELRKWLQSVANRLVSRFLQQERKKISLDDAPSELFTQQPTQEESLLKTECKKSLMEALRKLTSHERKLFELLREDCTSKQIAKQLGIKVNSVYRETNALKKKIQKLIAGGGQEKNSFITTSRFLVELAL